MADRSPSIFMGFVEVSGYYTNLRRGFEQLGVRSLFVPLHAHPFGFGAGAQLPIVPRLAQMAARKRAACPRWAVPLKVFWVIVSNMCQALLFFWCLGNFDTFVFSFQSSFFRLHDLPLLRALGKRVVFVFHGSDSRPPYLDGPTLAARHDAPEACLRLTRDEKRKLRQIERYATALVAHPLSAQLHERPAAAFTVMGLPTELTAAPTSLDAQGLEPNRPTRILHAPSNPVIKGTNLIRAAIAALQSRDHRIDYREITGRSHEEVLAEIARCDFVVDQLYSDTMMAGFAAEAALLERPAIVGGYAETELRRWFGPEHLPPVHYCHPDQVEAAVEKLLLDREYRMDLGRRARLFVESQWSPTTVAGRYLRLFEGEIPDEWVFDPQQVRYLHGCGASEDRLRDSLREVIGRVGLPGLHLSDKPELERLAYDFAFEATVRPVPPSLSPSAAVLTEA